MWQLNSIEYEIDISKNDSIVVLDAATQLGYDIPRFCYHEGSEVAGNCRMCLVEDINAAKPVVSCAMSLVPDLDIFLNTTRVKRARESVMEFLLINHPLDCPICDQGGECDSQDLAMVYGSDHGRFYEHKRSVENKNCGPVVKTVMNRCILCTRCVRFATSVMGFESFGITGRGEKSEIGSYIERIVDNDLSGNLVDICPVGALTSKPYSFLARPWELKKFFTLNIFDDEIQNIRVDIKENELLRITPSKNSTLMNHWITNRVRFSYEGLYRCRQSFPFILGLLSTWNTVLNTLQVLFLSFVEEKISTLPLIRCDETTLSNQDILFFKNFVNSTAIPYYQTNLLSMFCLPVSYSKMLEDDATSFIVLNLDIEFYAPILYIALQQRVSAYTLAWFSRLTNSQMSIISVFGSFSALVKLLRLKTWHSTILGKKVILVNSTLAQKITWFNPIVLTDTATQRAKLAFNLSARNNGQNVNLIPGATSYGLLGSSNARARSSLNIVQTTHRSMLNKNLVTLPTSTFFEQSFLGYFDTAYKVHITSKSVVVSAAKTPSMVIKALAELFGIKLFLHEKQNTLSSFSTLSRLHLNSKMAHSTSLKTFTRLNKKKYYNLHFLVKMSKALKSFEWKNIYLNTTK